jgi:hypothetical protein
MPGDVDLLVTVANARTLAETALGLEAVKKLDAFSAYREVMDSTNMRHLRQFVAYFERQTHASWPELLDEIAGDGIYVGIKFGKEPAPILMIVQGRSEQQVHEFSRIALALFEQELARQDERVKAVKEPYKGIETLRLDDKLFVAAAGSAIIVSNNEMEFHASLDLHLGKADKSCADVASIKDAQALLPPHSLATLWLNLDTVKKQPGAAAAFKTSPRNDPAQTIVFGGYLDIVGRSPFLAAALVREGDDFLLTVRMPKGRKGMGADAALHVPASTTSGSRPLLQPKGVLFSTSFYLDVARIWEDRDKLFPDKVAKSFEMADKNRSPLLGGLRISKTLPQLGSHHRFVAAVQPASSYKTDGGFSVPAFALVSELRQPEQFEKAMAATLRGAALFAGFSVRMKLVEEKVGDVTLVGYRFNSDQSGVDESIARLLRYYSPCFARIGDQFLWCSTVELGRELIGAIQAEKQSGSSSAVTSRVYSTGAADYLQSIDQFLVTGAVLDRAIPLDEAANEVKQLLSLIRSIGPLDVDVRYDDERFSYNIRLKNLK